MPTFTRKRISCRKQRTTVEPLFPGYVFVLGKHEKHRFTRHGCVVRCLHPRSHAEASLLDSQLFDIWRTADAGLPLIPDEPELQSGQRIEILEGPLRGVGGRFQRKGAKGCLVLNVDMLGAGVQVELLPEWRFEVVD